MLEYDPKRRITAAQVLEHEYLKMEPQPGRNALVPCQPGEPFVNYPTRPVDTTTSLKVSTFEEGNLVRPKWTGETPLSRLVRALISFKPVCSILKLGARQVLTSTAEKNNIPWREMTKEILESDVYKELDSIQNESLLYPDYYLNPFHAYDEGNLTWLAAAEAEAATKSMVRRAIPTASSVDEATQILRGNWLNAIEQHHRQPHTNSHHHHHHHSPNLHHI